METECWATFSIIDHDEVRVRAGDLEHARQVLVVFRLDLYGAAFVLPILNGPTLPGLFERR